MIASYSGEERYSEYLKERVRDARTTLKQLPTLRRLVSNFDNLAMEKRIHNLVFWKSAWATSGLGRVPDPESLSELGQFERYLNALEILTCEREKLGVVCGRLGGNTPEHSTGTFAELSVAGHLTQRFGRPAIELEPSLSSGGKSDVKVDFDGHQVFVEVSAINDSDTQRTLQLIREQVAERVWSMLNDRVVVHIEINPLALPVSNDEFDISSSIEAVMNFVKRTNMASLWISKKFLFYVAELTMGLDPDRAIYEQRERIGGSQLLDEIETEPYRSFAMETTPRLLSGSPVESFWCVPAREYPVVEVTDHLASPSSYHGLQHSQYLDQVVRKLGKEMKQIEEGHPNLIVLLASNWTVLPYEVDRSNIDDDFQSVRRRVESYLNQRGIRHLTAVVMYEQNYSGARIINNPGVSGPSTLPNEVLQAFVR
jgi:hypothetical protein